jgi:two-component system, OmpR family, phosphate regulon response regulator OmpR
MEEPHILIVDDDERIRSLLSRYLSENGFRVTLAHDAIMARSLFQTLSFDLVILDVMMPIEDGFSLGRAIRAGTANCHPHTPFIMLTAKIDASDRIEGLEGGADDYLAKPFEPRELLLRMNAILRRSAQTMPSEMEQIKFGDFLFTLSNSDLQLNGESVKLTDREKEMLKTLSSSLNDTVPRHLLAALGEEVNDRTVDVQITRLRRKLGDVSDNPQFIQTVRGFGYRLVATPFP